MDTNYLEAGAKRAMRLGNRGPVRFCEDGTVHRDILEAYRRYGFYVLENVISSEEIEELRNDFDNVLSRAPIGPGKTTDAEGRPSIDTFHKCAAFNFARPLSDPMGGTASTDGRYPAKMREAKASPDAPEHTILQVSACMELMDSALRLYGHPHLLRIAEAINGPDFTPFTDAIWVKEPGVGAAVSWHQDGTTLWDRPDFSADTHGFNFMTNLYATTPGNALWIVPETHDVGKVDIVARVSDNAGSDLLPDAVPLLCNPGDIAVCSRQMLHGSFPNESGDRRITYVFGFHRRDSVLGVESRDARTNAHVTYDEQRIHRRSRLIQLAIDARSQRFPQEPRFRYQPFIGEQDAIRWSEATRESVLKNYNLYDLFL